MSTFAANTAEMRSRSLAVQNTIERLRGDVNALQSGLQDLASTWQGSASANFQSVIADWRATQSRVEDSLTGIGTALTRASEFYDQAEQTNAAMFTY
ncbi:WXG100 family type VII secretion target [Paeniglutamicibacter cryotolerans]|uniref:ESAT-6-like protein n=1 Tax=Paeniglutamicibacter cryotolerans TaxID=670079 RepID=A0A839QI05_9MICC|nr:WXG100 family type VII secretion target [Paeniglutamicibacter cryotolerans]MBB2995407.1 WXG100 family type VII secretion target [Paeniglutamicibacter cryotolerans]